MGKCGAVRHCVSGKPANSEQEHCLCRHHPQFVLPEIQRHRRRELFYHQTGGRASAAQPLRRALEVDTLMHHWWLNGSKVLYLTQPLFEEDGRQTLIGYEGAEKPRGGRLFLGLLRRVNRLRWSIYKRLKFPSYLRAISSTNDIRGQT